MCMLCAHVMCVCMCVYLCVLVCVCIHEYFIAFICMCIVYWYVHCILVLHDVLLHFSFSLPVGLLAGQLEGGLQTIMVSRVPINGVG